MERDTVQVKSKQLQNLFIDYLIKMIYLYDKLLHSFIYINTLQITIISNDGKNTYISITIHNIFTDIDLSTVIYIYIT